MTVGASQALDIALRAIVNPLDEVLIPEPCFVSYAPLVSLAGGVPVPLHTRADDQFKLRPELIEEALTERTKALLLCSPSNPTGAVLSKHELELIAEQAELHDLLVLADEIYAELTYDEAYTSFPSLSGMRERTLLISGFSKGLP